jgi:hypothetical protein
MFQGISSDNIGVALFSGMIGSIIGGGIAVFGSYLAVRHMEYLRQSDRLKRLLRDLLAQLGSIGHPANLLINVEVDNAVSDIVPYFSAYSRRAFNNAWRQYRYDKDGDDIPSEYAKKGPKQAQEFMTQRLEKLIYLLG